MTYSSEVLADSPLGYWRLGEVANLGTATSSTNFGSEPPANAFDGSATTYWTTNAVSSGWLRNQLSAAYASTGYKIRRRDDIPARNPKDWTFEGSNDGSSWTTLDTRTGITWGTAGETKAFTFSNTTAYSYYRLNVSANNGDTYLSVAELTIDGIGLVDSSGNGHDGTTTNSPTLGVTGALAGDANTAATFNGTSTHGDVPYAAWAALTTAFSVEAWVKTSATGVRSISDRDAGSSRVYQFRQNGGSLEFVKISGSVVTASQATSINDGAWHHVVATYDGSNIRLYKDGSLINTTAAAGTLAGTDPITVGANLSFGYSQFWNGQLDELAYYNTVLSGTRIAAHYTAGTTVGTAATGTGALSLSGSGTGAAPVTGTGSLSLSGSGAAKAAATGTGSLSLSATGDVVPPSPATGTGSLSLSGSGAAGIGVTGTGSLTLSGAGSAVGSSATSGAGSLTLSGSGSATLADSGTGFLSLTATGTAQVLYVTDTSNLLNGRIRRASATSTVDRPVGTTPARAAVKYDKAVPYPPPTLVDGRVQ